MTKFTLTSEQSHAVDLFKMGGSLKVDARAGAGKTSTLVAMAKEVLVGRGLYMAFNRAIADEAQRKFGAGVTAKTAHSLAYVKYGALYRNRLNQRLTGGVVAEYLNIPDTELLSGKAIGNILISYITRYCNSADDSISVNHAPLSEIDLPIEDKHELALMKRQIATELLPYAQRLWAALVKTDGYLPVTHDVYLKLWALSKPKLNYSYIMIDEAQDLNPVLIKVLEDQIHSQLVYVGDPYQSIYGFRGAVNAMVDCHADNSAVLSQSFRFGQAIADVGMSVLKHQLKADVTIGGFAGIESEVEREQSFPEPQAILCRTNKQAIISLAACIEQGREPFVMGGVAEMIGLLQGIKELQAGKRSSSPEIAAFKTYAELVEYSETEAGRDLQSIVKLVSDYGTDGLIKVLWQVKDTREHDADVVISTAHKAKGREWGFVQLGDDFRNREDAGWGKEDAHLLYVATTRAQYLLDISNCSAALATL